VLPSENLVDEFGDENSEYHSDDILIYLHNLSYGVWLVTSIEASAYIALNVSGAIVSEQGTARRIFDISLR
jgi:hypothetical protein